LFLDTSLGLPDDMLTKVDRATMAVSLEARVPLLDREVVEFMSSLPSEYKTHGWRLKYLFRKAAGRVLPDTLVDRKKAGFSVPVARWLRRDLRDLVGDMLNASRLRNVGVMDPNAVAEVVRQHMDGRVDRGREIWSLLMFGLWHARYVEGPGRGDVLVASDEGARTQVLEPAEMPVPTGSGTHG
jgi:asparagine synthase (glutamine-hydrolysing)